MLTAHLGSGRGFHGRVPRMSAPTRSVFCSWDTATQVNFRRIYVAKNRQIVDVRRPSVFWFSSPERTLGKDGNIGMLTSGTLGRQFQHNDQHNHQYEHYQEQHADPAPATARTAPTLCQVSPDPLPHVVHLITRHTHFLVKILE